MKCTPSVLMEPLAKALMTLIFSRIRTSTRHLKARWCWFSTRSAKLRQMIRWTCPTNNNSKWQETICHFANQMERCSMLKKEQATASLIRRFSMSNCSMMSWDDRCLNANVLQCCSEKCQRTARRHRSRRYAGNGSRKMRFSATRAKTRRRRTYTDTWSGRWSVASPGKTSRRR